MNAFELRQLRDKAEHETTAAMYEIAAQLAVMNERQEKVENEWINLWRSKVSAALDKVSKGIFG